MLIVEANRQNLAYLDQGGGNPIVFVHGSISDYRAWSGQIEPFSKKYRVIAYSRRYAYPNKKKGDYTDDTISDNAADLAAMINKLGIAPAYLVGHSYGAYTSLFCALHNQKLVRALVLAEPPVLPLLTENPQNSSVSESFSSLSKKLESVRKELKNGNADTALELFVNEVVGKENALEQLPSAVRAMIADNTNALREVVDVRAYSHIATKEVRSLDIPTLLVVGQLSPKFFHGVVDILSKNLPNNQVITMTGASHLLQLEKPTEFNSRVLEFLEKQS